MQRNLKKLSIFEIGGTNEGSERYIDLSKDDYAMIGPGIDLPQFFVKFASKKGKLLKYKFPEFHKMLGVQELDSKRLLETYLCEFLVLRESDDPDFTNEQKKMIIRYLDNQWIRFESENLKSDLQTCPFVPAQRLNDDDEEEKKSDIDKEEPEIYVAPKELFDPRNKFFANLFRNDLVFPAKSSIYSETRFLNFLQKVGMNSEMTQDTFLKVCFVKKF